LGLPESWKTIASWLDDTRDIVPPDPEVLETLTSKNPEIPVLHNYTKEAPTDFWSIFPKNYDKKLKRTVNIKILKKLIQKCWFSWTLPQKILAKKTLRRLQGLEPVKLKQKLPGIHTRNASSATENGFFITDTICSWIKKGYVVGPYKEPPFPEFRVNPLMAAVQKNKIRPILNLSSPKNFSLNDAIDMMTIEKINMSSPKLFAEELKKAGQGALFSKSDINDAYKLIPNAVQQYRLFGFKWLNRFFFDKTKVFGSKEAPASFDSLPETIVNIVCSLYKIPKTNVQRQLDDVPMVASKESKLTEKFTSAYKHICQQLNVPLAEECKKHEKAFGPSTFGTVLGIQFDSELMEWCIAKEKEKSLQDSIDFFLTRKTCTLKQIQKLHGKLANFAQTMDFMKGFRFNILALLNKFQGQEGTKIIPESVRQDLWVWKKCVADSRNGFPIRDIFGAPPLFPLTILSDAAGAALEWVGGKSINKTIKNDRGVASVCHCNNVPQKTALLSWPPHLLNGAKNRNGAYFGTKSGTLEAIGLILPFISYPKYLIGKHIVLQVDNTSLIYGWEKRYCKNDPETSLLLRVLHVIEIYLSCKIYVTHVKRCSNTMAELADALSRKSTTTRETLALLENSEMFFPSGSLYAWLCHPVLDWTLPEKIIDDIKNLL
jgi:hypothetical protein